MKKIYLLFLMLLPLAFMSSCDSDDRFPDVDINVELSNVVKVDGVYYAVQGEVVTVDAVTVKPMIPNATCLTGVDYYLNYRLIGYNMVAPYGASIEMNRAGENILQMYTAILQVDKTATSAYIELPIVVVPSVEDIPGYDGSEEKAVYTRRVSPDTLSD